MFDVDECITRLFVRDPQVLQPTAQRGAPGQWRGRRGEGIAPKGSALFAKYFESVILYGILAQHCV